MSIMEHAIEASQIKRFLKLLDKIENKYDLREVGETTWREYCFSLGQVLRVVLKELEDNRE